MGDIKFYSPVDFDDTSSGVTIEGNLIAHANVGIGVTGPGSKLEVLSGTSNTATFKNSVGQQTVTFGSTTNTAYSDIILKTNNNKEQTARNLFILGQIYREENYKDSSNVVFQQIIDMKRIPYKYQIHSELQIAYRHRIHHIQYQ